MSYKVAVTSLDGNSIDAHFGHAESFLIIDVEEESGIWKKSEIRSTGTGGQGESAGHDDAHLDRIAELIGDCSFLLTEKIGMKPYRILQKKGITSLESPRDLSGALVKLNRYYRKNKKRFGGENG
ncbi:MAG: NifB/NifX family molybdenum-iron cluster-binding protein [Brevinematales bacterium]|jgi:predicted Fe-Mo cluster-binding NifX family protein